MQPSTRVDKLRQKIARNLDSGFSAFAKKSLQFAVATARSAYLLREVNQLGVGVRVLDLAPKINNAGRIELGDDVVLDAKVTAIYFELKPGALLTIDSDCYLNDGVWLGCTGRISIGRRVLIGPGVRIFDNSYHGLYQRRVLPAPRPVTIEDDVWIATGSIILAGVTVGRGSIVSANSVVSKDVPPFTIVGGNPAVHLKTLDPATFEATSR